MFCIAPERLFSSKAIMIDLDFVEGQLVGGIAVTPGQNIFTDNFERIPDETLIDRIRRWLHL